MSEPHKQSEPAAPSPPRRFLPQPVETTSRFQRKGDGGASKSKEDSPSKVAPPQSTAETTKAGASRRFKPEPIEVSTKSSKDSRKAHEASTSTSRPPESSTDSNTKDAKIASTRKFAPQLIETSKRRRRSTDTAPALLPTDKTEVSPGDESKLTARPKLPRPALVPKAPANTPAVSQNQLPEVCKTAANITMARRSSSIRRHSFMVPALDTIESSESEESKCPSLSTSPSATSEEGNRDRMRESCDDKVSGYLLELAARAAEKQLREQAMAAFPNDDFHEPVDHFAIDRDSSDSDVEMADDMLSPTASTVITRKDPVAQRGWPPRELRKPHEQHLRGPRQLSERALIERTSGPNRNLSPSPHLAPAVVLPDDPMRPVGARQPRDVDLNHMRSAASPPMLGADMKFRLCISPQATSLEVGHSSHGRLWQSKEPSESGVGGLWHGLCTAETAPLSVPEVPNGIMTPKTDSIDSSSSAPGVPDITVNGQMPNRPNSRDCGSDPRIAHLDSRLRMEDQVDREYSDEFVTQVYNYLSLGYPSLARRYDEELSKISRISSEELCKNDGNAAAVKGFVGLEIGVQDAEASRTDPSAEARCPRWRALRIYVREWARLNPDTVGEPDGSEMDADMWGARARRGSWAI
ncbi:MAG: hypothetical protein M1817_002518 [Caeruleum heppii]|nr:MAG: hypothetical protein M1817_002518 [Caeruleum heppii]